MDGKRTLNAAIAIALFGAGVATGSLLRGGSRGPDADVPLASSHASVTEPSSSAPPVVGASSDVDGGAPSAAAPAGSGADPSAPPGTGEVAVIRGSETTGSGSRPGASAGDATSSGEGAPPTDGGVPTGALSREAIQDVVRSHRSELGFCFAWQLHSHPELGGRLIMDITIGADGSVTHAEVADDQLGDPTVLDCFRGVTRRMRFPPPEGGELRVRYPFVLTSGPPPDEPSSSSAEPRQP